MNVIVYGTRKCGETRKAERWLKERGIPFQFRDVAANPLTETEILNMAPGRDASRLIDEGSKRFISRGLAFMEFDPVEELASDPALLTTPVVRVDKKYFVRPDMAALPLG